jgi:predicted transcriptional regulator
MTDSRLQRAVRLNYDLFRKYVGFLHGRGLLDRGAPAEEPAAWRLTAAGHALRGDMLAWLARLFGGP